MRKRNPALPRNNLATARRVIHDFGNLAVNNMSRDYVDKLIGYYYHDHYGIPIIRGVLVESMPDNKAYNIARDLQENAWDLIEGITLEEKQKKQHGINLEEQLHLFS